MCRRGFGNMELVFMKEILGVYINLKVIFKEMIVEIFRVEFFKEKDVEKWKKRRLRIRFRSI